MKPKTALIEAATSEAPNVSLYDATTRGFATARPELRPATATSAARTSAASGSSTIKLR